MIEGRHAPRKRERMLIGHRDRDAETQMLRHLRHGRYGQKRIVQRHVETVPERRVSPPAVDITHPERVGDEEPVEQSAFENPRKLGPVAALRVSRRLATWMTPQAGRQMVRCRHGEGIQAKFFRQTLSFHAPAWPRQPDPRQLFKLFYLRIS